MSLRRNVRGRAQFGRTPGERARSAGANTLCEHMRLTLDRGKVELEPKRKAGKTVAIFCRSGLFDSRSTSYCINVYIDDVNLAAQR